MTEGEELTTEAEDEVAGAEEAPAAEPTSAEDPLAELTRERDEYLELAQRTRADFENFRKRTASQSADAELRGKAAIARELLPAVDNLERALQAAGIDPDAGTSREAEEPSREVSAHEALAQGVALVYRETRSALGRVGVESYDPVGERFDPVWHEALSTMPSAEAEAGTVIETLQKGYRLGEIALRPARVVVAAQAPAASGAEGGDDGS